MLKSFPKDAEKTVYLVIVFLSNVGHIKFPFWMGHDFNTQGKGSLGLDTICPSS